MVTVRTKQELEVALKNKATSIRIEVRMLRNLQILFVQEGGKLR